jgi:seryl-tRNA synthetase
VVKLDMNDAVTVFTNEETQFMREIDAKLCSLLQGYTVSEWTLPSIIDGDVLRRCGYFTSMPNQLTALATVKRENLKDISDNNRCLCDTDFDSSHNVYLTPAVCLNVYPMLRKGEYINQIITVKGSVFRYEDGKFRGLERQWEFTVRDFIAVGGAEFVKGFLEGMKAPYIALAKEISANTNISLKEASDHFYPTRANQMKERYQQKNALKFEIIADIEPYPLAIGSFNYHGTHFSKEFGFDDNDTIVTGCIGVGFERWVKLWKASAI